MADTMSDEELTKRQFIGFVSLMANSIMQQLGKLINPVTGKPERSLEGAKATIDMLRMLQVKTTGNLSKEEQQVLDSSLSNCQLNYVDELKRGAETAATSETAAGPDQEPAEDEKGKAKA